MGQVGIFFWGSGTLQNHPDRGNLHKYQHWACQDSFTPLLYIQPLLQLLSSLSLIKVWVCNRKQWTHPALFFMDKGKKQLLLSFFLLGKGILHIPCNPIVRAPWWLFWGCKHITHWASIHSEMFEIGGTGGWRLMTLVQLTGVKQGRREAQMTHQKCTYL